MENKICEKCKSPIIVEDGKYVCISCGNTYGKIPNVIKPKNYSDFFEKLSFEEFKKINKFIAEKVVIQTAPVGECSKRSYYRPYGTNYVIAALSNGQYFTRFTSCLDFSEKYRGQCAAENWVGVNRIFATSEYSIGITDDGKLQPTLCEVDSFLKEIDNDLRMRQIVDISDKYKQFLGVSLDGKIVIINPFGVWCLHEDNEEEFKMCTDFLKKIKNWPSIKYAYKCGYVMLVCITEQDKLVCASTNIKNIPFCDELESLNDVDSITYSCDDDHTMKIHVLQKDGSVTLISFKSFYESYKKGEVTKNELKLSNVVQIKNINIAKLNCYGEILSEKEELLYLKSNGDLIYNNKILAKNVISIVDNGYICVDGTVYERKISTDTEYVQIEGLKLFDSIETLEQEWEDTKNACKNFLPTKQEKLCTLNEEAKDLEKQISNLGLFKGKEKKAFRQELATIRENISIIQHEIDNVPDGTPKWHRLPEETGRYYSIGELSAMVDRSIASGSSKSKSVVGSAVVGGVIAGPVGAVVGAIYAADKNNKKKN